ncbi:LysR family transcriptional regulator [Limosilactobacillus sp.]|uniref:LysR family transcriptional regulator n=1 Tax=Limosilactobacillus sp. TaxID=2773925 RepID=UPI00345E9A03
METRVLNYFLKIAQLNNMSKAAEQLHITQPTLSRQIKTLEDSLGTKLFNRDNKKMTLTNSGIIFQKRAQQIVQLIAKAEQDVSDQQGLSGVVSIGCVESTVTNFLGTMIASFHSKYPHVRFSMYDADGDDIREKLDRGTVDLGFLLTPVELAKYNSVDLPVEDRWCLLVPKDDPIAKQTKISLEALRKLPLIIPSRNIIQSEILAWAKTPDSELHIVSSQNLLSNSLFLVKAGIGYAICASGAFSNRPDDDIVSIPIDTTTVIKHAMAWRKNYTLSQSTQTFIEFIKDEINNPDSLWQLYIKEKREKEN